LHASTKCNHCMHASPAGKRQLPKISLADTSNHVLGVVHTLRVRERHGMPQ